MEGAIKQKKLEEAMERERIALEVEAVAQAQRDKLWAERGKKLEEARAARAMANPCASILSSSLGNV